MDLIVIYSGDLGEIVSGNTMLCTRQGILSGEEGMK
jgi:hypothetical protein